MVDAGRVLPRRVVLLSWHVEDTPESPAHEAAVEVNKVGRDDDDILTVDVTLGYRERLDVGHVLGEACEQEPDLLDGLSTDTAYYVVSKSIPQVTRPGGMARWRQRLFLVIDRLSTDRVDQLDLPHHRVVVIGRQLDL
jgi:KUP system potassium uptake protein